MGILIISKECMEFFEKGCIVVNLSKRANIHFFSQYYGRKAHVCVWEENLHCVKKVVWTCQCCGLILEFTISFFWCIYEPKMVVGWSIHLGASWCISNYGSGVLNGIVVSLPRTIGRRNCKEGDNGVIKKQGEYFM
jgi:hypothetical protein